MSVAILEEEVFEVQGDRERDASVIKQTTRFTREEWALVKSRLNTTRDKFQRRSWITIMAWARGEGGDRHTHPDEQEQILAGVARYVQESAWSEQIMTAIARSLHVKPEVLRRHAESYAEKKALKKAN